LLIAPVTTLNQNIEFLTYELDMENILNETLALALDDLGDSSSGQLWVLDYDETEDRYLNIYSAKSEPLIATIRDRFTTSILNAIDRPITESYTVREAGQNVQREAALAQAFAVNRPFVLMMSRNASEAREGVDDDLQLILIGSIGAVIVLAFLGMAGTQIIVRETTQRQAETGMRATARSLLEVSRALNSTLELDVVLDRILSEFERLIPYHSASILLLTDQGLEVAAHRGPDVEAHQRIFGWDEARAAREVIARGHPVIINNTAEDERWTVVEGSDIRSWLGLPLKVFERSVGVLNINATTENRFSPQDISLAETFADQASVALQNARLHQIEVTRIEQELNIAQSIQMSLMPVESPDYPDLEFAFHSIPARQVSGDFFQIVPLTDNQVGIFVGDVSGKGMPAAMIMAIISTALRDEVNRHRNPGDLLNVLNKRLIDRLKQNNMNSALLTGLYNPATRSLALANAGMGLPYVRDPDGTWTEIEIGGYPLGSSESTIYGTRTIYFGYGSLVVLYSDGIIEAQNWRGEFFGFERFEALLNTLPADATAPTALDTILQAVHTHLGEETPQDDITLMVIRGLAQEIVREEDEDEDTLPGKERGDSRVWQERFLSRQGILSEKSEGYSMPRENVEVFLPSTLGYEKVARDAAEAIAREMGFSEDRIDDLKTAVAEACMNAIEHGNLEDRSTSVTVLLSAAADSLEIRVSDRGRQTIPNPLPPPGGEDKSRGWGMFFIQSLMDEVEITELPEGGNVVKMTIYLGKDQAASDEEDSASAEK
jgi:serine phosphatase RsbU (regulator of sigma subunit)/anti-sigma regulatory factor (Ser/Thr protein kinase)